MLDIEIKKVAFSDLSVLQNISVRTFTETFSDSNTVENMNAYISEALSLSTLEKEMATEGTQFYFAVHNTEVIGYLKVNTGAAQSEENGDDALEIERIYVLQTYHGKKVGLNLYYKAIEIAKDLGKCCIWLGVWEKNHKALSFYRKLGFKEFDQHIFKLGEDHQTDLLMRQDI